MQPIVRLEQLQLALLAESTHEKEEFQTSIQKKSIAQLVEEGIVWYPLRIVDTGFSVGEYPYITLEIAEDKLVSHRFKSGSIIRFFQNRDGDIATHAVEATVYYLSSNQTKIILNQNDLPEWYDEGKIGIVLDYDEKSMIEMKRALDAIIIEKDSPAAQIRDILYRGRTPSSSPLSDALMFKNPHLNLSQKNAITNILESDDIAIVHGPPGTGKTTTLVEAIYQLSQRESTILVTASSNAAVDLLVEKLHNTDLRVVRIGNLSRIDQDILSHTLDYKIEHSPEYLEIKKLRKKADEYRKMALKYKRQFGPDEREQRRLLLQEAKEIHKHIVWIEDYLIAKILDQAQVVCTTLVGVESKHIRYKKFKTCVIDEVSQALEPASWIPILKSEKIVLAGDPFQLPPTVKSREAEKLGLSTTLLDIGYSLQSHVSLLDTQYRMKSEIMSFSNMTFYENKLQAAPSTDSNYYQIGDTIYPPLEFIDTAGCGFEEVLNPKTESLYNPDECKLVMDYIQNLLQELTYVDTHISIGIIAPYREQVTYMRLYDEENARLCTHYDIDIDTIDSFQGQERDIILISMVRSNDRGEIGFLKDYRRMNVAFTRAKKLVRVFGDGATLSQDTFYNQWIDYCQNINGYRSAWEFLG